MIKFILEQRVSKELIALPKAHALLLIAGFYLFLFLVLFMIEGFALWLYAPVFLFLAAAIGAVVAEIIMKDDSNDA